MGVLARDKFNLFILFAQAPIIALLTYLVVDAKGQRDFPYFILALVALWFGTSVAAREVIRERAVYNRERMVNLRLLPYVGSKLFVLLLIVSVQCILLFGTLKLLDVTTLMDLPGRFGGFPQLFVMILTGMVGVALGLFISAVVRTSEMATSLVPLILIPQILFLWSCGSAGWIRKGCRSCDAGNLVVRRNETAVRSGRSAREGREAPSRLQERRTRALQADRT